MTTVLIWVFSALLILCILEKAGELDRWIEYLERLEEKIEKKVKEEEDK